MSNLARAMMMGAAGAASGATYVDDVFSTYLYDGTGSTQSINNGIDLAGEGGAVWIKARSNETNKNHTIVDSARGKDTGNSYKVLYPNLTSEEYSPGSAANATVSSFDSNGFTAGNNLNTNVSGGDYVSWSFRKAPGFFDVVTYTGNSSSAQTISHNLGSAPSIMIIKSASTAENWVVYSKDAYETLTGNFRLLTLNSTNDAGGNINRLNSTQPTSSVFTVGGDANTNGEDYVAYLFASDEPVFGTNEDESIIKCGTYTGNGSSTGPEINLGFEPQWVMVKNASSSGLWLMVDTMRGITASSDPYLQANGAEAEVVYQWLDLTATGFKLTNTGTSLNSNGDTYIYMAIRRPHKPPTAGTDVYKSVYGNDNSIVIETGFTVDMALSAVLNQNPYNHVAIDRLRDRSILTTSNTTAEVANGAAAGAFAINDGMNAPSLWGTALYHFFKRAPGFFDVVSYEGFITAGNPSGSINHNLNVIPELVICRNRDTTNRDWIIWHKDLAAGDYLFFNTYGEAAFGVNWITPTSTQITYLEPVASFYVAVEGYDYINYLFATLPGISKVGSYSGDTGNAVDVDCGFIAGARFILIKRKNGTGDWYVWNTARGIVSGNDPYVLLNTNAAEVTNTDYIDPLNSGFTVTATAPAALNETGGTYIFLAIA